MNSNLAHSRLQKYLVISINAALGIFLWFDYFTKYSLAGRYSEFLFPPVVGIIGFISYRFLARENPKKQNKFLYKLTSAPSIIGGFLSLILIIPPMCLFSVAILNTANLEQQTEYEISPDGWQVAKVYQSYVGLVDGDFSYSIRVSPRWFPFIEKEIFTDVSESPTWCVENKSDCIRWKNKNTILIPETMKEIKTGTIEFSMPVWLVEIVLFFSLFSSR